MHPCTHSFSEGLGGSTLFWPFAGSQSALSVAYSIQVVANCFSLLMHWTFLAATFARASAGSSNAARRAMMAMTTSNSISVKPRRPLLKLRIQLTWNDCLLVTLRQPYYKPKDPVSHARTHLHNAAGARTFLSAAALEVNRRVDCRHRESSGCCCG